MSKKDTITELKQLADEIKNNLDNSKKPLIVEFAGLPKSGKTTLIDSLALFLRRNNISVKVITERASVCPIKQKTNMNFNVWTGCSSLLQMLEQLENNNLNVIILDRGIYDSIIWLHVLKELDRVDNADLTIISKFFLIDAWFQKIDMVIHMKTTVEKAIEREYQNLLTDIPGTIMTSDILNKYLSASELLSDELESKIKMYYDVDTTNQTISECIEDITVEILNKLKTLSDEELVVINKESFDKYISVTDYKKDKVIFNHLNEIILNNPQYLYRSKVEKNNDLVQIIAAAMIIYRGKVLVTTKHEIDIKSRFHGRKMIWVGGHLRKEDFTDHSIEESVKNCISREVSEEIELHKELKSEFCGFVYDRTSSRSLQHFGIIYKLVIPDNYDTNFLENVTFKERTGQAITTQFVELNEVDLNEYSDEFENWSLSLLRNIFKIKLNSSSENQLQMF